LPARRQRRRVPGAEALSENEPFLHEHVREEARRALLRRGLTSPLQNSRPAEEAPAGHDYEIELRAGIYLPSV